LAVRAPGKGVCGEVKIFGYALLQPVRSLRLSERLKKLFYTLGRYIPEGSEKKKLEEKLANRYDTKIGRKTSK